VPLKWSGGPGDRSPGLPRIRTAAEERARELGLGYLELQTRVELTGNQAALVAMGFVEVARTGHDGYARVTSITYRRAVRGMSTA